MLLAICVLSANCIVCSIPFLAETGGRAQSFSIEMGFMTCFTVNFLADGVLDGTPQHAYSIPKFNRTHMDSSLVNTVETRGDFFSDKGFDVMEASILSLL